MILVAKSSGENVDNCGNIIWVKWNGDEDLGIEMGKKVDDVEANVGNREGVIFVEKRFG